MIKDFILRFILTAFFFATIGPLPNVSAQSILDLPAPGIMINTSVSFEPLEFKGILVNVKNPLRFDFLVDKGQSRLQGQALKDEITRLAKYFLTCLTVPENDLWVNLSPYEKDRIVPDSFGITVMGKDLLEQDYLLKQIMASLSYPENELGKKFWQRVYTRAYELYGTTEIPINTFNKVWILPKSADVYAMGNSAFVIKSRLDVMLEADYKSYVHHMGNSGIDSSSQGLSQNAGAYSPIFRDVILPELRQEVNTGKNFAVVRQVYNSMILAAWYKRHLKDSLLGRMYVGKNKVNGVDIPDKDAKERIFQQYLKAYKKCVYNYIKEDFDPATQQTVPRKYVSGGMYFEGFGQQNSIYRERRPTPNDKWIGSNLAMATVDVTARNKDGSMITFDSMQAQAVGTHPFRQVLQESRYTDFSKTSRRIYFNDRSMRVSRSINSLAIAAALGSVGLMMTPKISASPDQRTNAGLSVADVIESSINDTQQRVSLESDLKDAQQKKASAGDKGTLKFYIEGGDEANPLLRYIGIGLEYRTSPLINPTKAHDDRQGPMDDTLAQAAKRIKIRDNVFKVITEVKKYASINAQLERLESTGIRQLSDEIARLKEAKRHQLAVITSSLIIPLNDLPAGSTIIVTDAWLDMEGIETILKDKGVNEPKQATQAGVSFEESLENVRGNLELSQRSRLQKMTPSHVTVHVNPTTGTLGAGMFGWLIGFITPEWTIYPKFVPQAQSDAIKQAALVWQDARLNIFRQLKQTLLDLHKDQLEKTAALEAWKNRGNETDPEILSQMSAKIRELEDKVASGQLSAMNMGVSAAFVEGAAARSEEELSTFAREYVQGAFGQGVIDLQTQAKGWKEELETKHKDQKNVPVILDAINSIAVSMQEPLQDKDTEGLPDTDATGGAATAARSFTIGLPSPIVSYTTGPSSNSPDAPTFITGLNYGTTLTPVFQSAGSQESKDIEKQMSFTQEQFALAQHGKGEGSADFRQAIYGYLTASLAQDVVSTGQGFNFSQMLAYYRSSTPFDSYTVFSPLTYDPVHLLLTGFNKLIGHSPQQQASDITAEALIEEFKLHAKEDMFKAWGDTGKGAHWQAWDMFFKGFNPYISLADSNGQIRNEFIAPLQVLREEFKPLWKTGPTADDQIPLDIRLMRLHLDIAKKLRSFGPDAVAYWTAPVLVRVGSSAGVSYWEGLRSGITVDTADHKRALLDSDEQIAQLTQELNKIEAQWKRDQVEVDAKLDAGNAMKRIILHQIEEAPFRIMVPESRWAVIANAVAAKGPIQNELNQVIKGKDQDPRSTALNILASIQLHPSIAEEMLAGGSMVISKDWVRNARIDEVNAWINLLRYQAQADNITVIRRVMDLFDQQKFAYEEFLKSDIAIKKALVEWEAVNEGYKGGSFSQPALDKVTKSLELAKNRYLLARTHLESAFRGLSLALGVLNDQEQRGFGIIQARLSTGPVPKLDLMAPVPVDGTGKYKTQAMLSSGRKTISLNDKKVSVPASLCPLVYFVILAVGGLKMTPSLASEALLADPSVDIDPKMKVRDVIDSIDLKIEEYQKEVRRLERLSRLLGILEKFDESNRKLSGLKSERAEAKDLLASGKTTLDQESVTILDIADLSGQIIDVKDRIKWEEQNKNAQSTWEQDIINLKRVLKDLEVRKEQLIEKERSLKPTVIPPVSETIVSNDKPAELKQDQSIPKPTEVPGAPIEQNTTSVVSPSPVQTAPLPVVKEELSSVLNPPQEQISSTPIEDASPAADDQPILEKKKGSRILNYLRSTWLGSAVRYVKSKIFKKKRVNTDQYIPSSGIPKFEIETSSLPHSATWEEKAILPQLEIQLQALVNEDPAIYQDKAMIPAGFKKKTSFFSKALGWLGGLALAVRTFSLNPVNIIASAIASPFVSAVYSTVNAWLHEKGHAVSAKVLYPQYKGKVNFLQWKEYFKSQLLGKTYEGENPYFSFPVNDKRISRAGVATTVTTNGLALAAAVALTLAHPWLLPVSAVMGAKGVSAIRSAWRSDKNGPLFNEQTGEYQYPCGISVHSQIGKKRVLAERGNDIPLERIGQMADIESDRGRHQVGGVVFREGKDGKTVITVEKELEVKIGFGKDAVKDVIGEMRKSLPPIVADGPKGEEYLMDTYAVHNRLASGGEVTRPAAHPHIGQIHQKILWNLQNGILTEGRGYSPDLDVEVARYEKGKGSGEQSDENTDNVTAGALHNGDNDEYQPLDTDRYIDNLDELRALGAQLIHFQGALPPGDSPVIPLLIQFHLTQGNPDASVRFAHVRTHHKTIDELKKDLLTENEEIIAGEVLDRGLRKFGAVLSRPGFNDPDKTLNDLYVTKKMLEDDPNDVQLQFQFKALEYFKKYLINEFKKEADAGKLPEKIAQHWRQADADKVIREFVELAVYKFFTGNRKRACKEFEERSKGTYGLAVKVSTELNGLTLLSRKLGMVWGYNLDKGYLDASSDPYALLRKYQNGDKLDTLMFLDPRGKGEMADFRVSKATGKLTASIFSVEKNRYLKPKEIYDREYPLNAQNPYYHPMHEYKNEKQRLMEDMNEITPGIAELVKSLDDVNASKPQRSQDPNYQSGMEVFKNLMAYWIKDKMDDQLYKGGKYQEIFSKVHQTIIELSKQCSTTNSCSEEQLKFLDIESHATAENSVLMSLFRRWLSRDALALASLRVDHQISQQQLHEFIPGAIHKRAAKLTELLIPTKLNSIFKLWDQERLSPYSGKPKIGLLFAGDENSDNGPRTSEDSWNALLPNLPKKFVGSHEILEYESLPFDVTSPAVTILTSKAGGNFNTMQALDVMVNAVGIDHVWGVTARPDSPLSVALGQRLRPESPFTKHVFYTGNHFRAQTQGASETLTTAFHNLLPIFVALQFEKYCPGERPFGLDLNPERVKYLEQLKEKMMLSDAQRITGKDEKGNDLFSSVYNALVKRGKYFAHRLWETPLVNFLHKFLIYPIFLCGPFILGALQLCGIIPGPNLHSISGFLTATADYLFTMYMPLGLTLLYRMFQGYKPWVRLGPPSNINVIGYKSYPNVQEMFLRVIFSRSFANWGSQVRSETYEQAIARLGPSMNRGSWIWGHLGGTSKILRKAKGAFKQLKVTRTGIFRTKFLRTGAISFTTSRGAFKPDGVVSDDNVDIGGEQFTPPNNDPLLSRVYNSFDAWGADLAFKMQSSVMADTLTFGGRAWDPSRKVSNALSLTTESGQPPPDTMPKNENVDEVMPNEDTVPVGSAQLQEIEKSDHAMDSHKLLDRSSTRQGGIDMNSSRMQLNMLGEDQNILGNKDNAMSSAIINGVSPKVSGIITVTPDMLKTMLGEAYFN